MRRLIFAAPTVLNSVRWPDHWMGECGYDQAALRSTHSDRVHCGLRVPPKPPVVHVGRCLRARSRRLGPPGEHGREYGEVVRVACEDVAAESDSADHQVRIDDISGLGLSEEPSERTPVVKRVDGDCLQECRKPGLAGSGSPHLSYDRVGGVKLGSRSACAARKVWADRSLRSREIRKPASRITGPYREAMAAMSWSAIGPSSASHWG